ncbi:MAG: MtrB/PioB family decaheme-associated outer membrane protein, partial [Rhizobiales bacterium]|nr:MtrB/PioB family decaheme-associated outer membrane protein [Hyphomicrobiales bacterium]
SSYLNQQSLAKFYEYRDLRPGPFANVRLSTGSNNGLYQIDAGGRNIGYRDQSYYLDASKAGQHYFSAIWDQAPHLYSTSAQTFYQGLGTNALTLPSGLQGVGGFGNVPFVPGTAPAEIAPFLYRTDIGIKRDTGSVAYRWTPTDAWDIQADYSHLTRTGTQVSGLIGFGVVDEDESSAVQVPKPVDDRTQNYGLNGEYAGTSPWGQKLTIKLAYNGSTYTDKLTSFTIQNPYDAATQTADGLSPVARMSLWPSNQMNAVSGTMGAELPWKSRYAGTLSYTMMRQNDAFIPMSFQEPSFALPASSLNGKINTLLSNNVVTTAITPDLTSKLSYRYYNFDNSTPELLFPTWDSLDRTNATNPEPPVRALQMSYTKQNAGEQLVWHPSRAWTLGAIYGYERYDWTRQAADATNEHSGKVFADWKPTSWFALRSSGSYANRRYVNYDLQQATDYQNPDPRPAMDPAKFLAANRQYILDNRERWKANVAMDIVVAPGLTVTPNFKYQDDYYGLNPENQLGLTDSRSWNGGVDVTYVINPRASVMFGYLREYRTQLVYNIVDSDMPPGGDNFVQTNDRTVVDTFTGLIRYTAIPDKLDTELRYTASRGVLTQNILNAGAAPVEGQFPDITTWFQRLDAKAIYTFDKAQVASLGWKGNVKAKLRYTWERNSVSNWQQDPLAPFGNFDQPNVIYLSQYNPNYNVHLLTASLAWTW